MLVFGWDVSTAVVGCCLMDSEDLSVLRMERFILKGTHYDRYEQITSIVAEVHGRWIEDAPLGSFVHYVEAPLANFTHGRTNKDTLMKLAAVNAVVSWKLVQWSRPDCLVHIPPVTAKRICGLKVPKGGDKKSAAMDFVASVCPDFKVTRTKKGNPVRGTDDMADAYLLARSGCLLVRGEATFEPSAKARRAAKGPGRPTPRKRGRARVQLSEEGLPLLR